MLGSRDEGTEMKVNFELDIAMLKPYFCEHLSACVSSLRSVLSFKGEDEEEEDDEDEEV
jgi:hypothetical protein